ncbi:DUF2680 domain-containing protein [Miniphocaeibacter halophilus]|uniref:DUF2680 domain-containing protein n=1 Tax=Miniphocaeibacter halophilus TaxID=2931922 RepID=A0AC61MS26_9FIRM|nr:DUF2680 domain-containing protein [Miniphocaeibacter halophilus]QQK08237.1 DUF2680 domain-containing protein [Miniphocaeibacter halophilus]
MKKISKKLILMLALVLVLGVGTTSLAVENNRVSHPDILSNITNKPLEEIIEIRTTTGKTYGQIAEEFGVLEEYKEEMFTIKKNFINERVDNGYLDREEADRIITNMEKNKDLCDGENLGYRKLCGNYGLGIGMLNKKGRGNGLGTGQRLQDGTGRIENNNPGRNQTNPTNNTREQKQNTENSNVQDNRQNANVNAQNANVTTGNNANQNNAPQGNVNRNNPQQNNNQNPTPRNNSQNNNYGHHGNSGGGSGQRLQDGSCGNVPSGQGGNCRR